MIIGMKVGPQKQSLLDLEVAKPPFVEVWFNIVKKDQDYPQLFSELNKRTIQAGLHFWGHLPDGTATNIALDNPTIVEASMKQLFETIDIAAANNFLYVNIHPSTMGQVFINLEKQQMIVQEHHLAKTIAEENFLANYNILHTYAKERNVVLTLETVPFMETNNWYDKESRNFPFDNYTLPNSTVVKAATMGFTVANDFGHTSCTIASENRSEIYQTLTTITNDLFSQTRLLHLGYIIPPYNGTDIHNDLDDPLFETDQAIPNKKEMIDLLRLFKDRNDVWALVEPLKDHVKNFRLAKELQSNV